jgi:hypothetical protein
MTAQLWLPECAELTRLCAQVVAQEQNDIDKAWESLPSHMRQLSTASDDDSSAGASRQLSRSRRTSVKELEGSRYMRRFALLCGRYALIAGGRRRSEVDLAGGLMPISESSTRLMAPPLPPVPSAASMQGVPSASALDVDRIPMPVNTALRTADPRTLRWPGLAAAATGSFAVMPPSTAGNTAGNTLTYYASGLERPPSLSLSSGSMQQEGGHAQGADEDLSAMLREAHAEAQQAVIAGADPDDDGGWLVSVEAPKEAPKSARSARKPASRPDEPRSARKAARPKAAGSSASLKPPAKGTKAATGSASARASGAGAKRL